MNSLTVPPSPNWYEVSILACSPDNTLIYGAKNDLVVIEDSKPQEANYVRIISRAHSQKILSVDINKNWGQPNKFAVTVSEDKIVKIWNIATMKKHSSHSEHLNHSKVIGATFAGPERVISVSEDGIIVVWNVTLNETTILKDLFTSRVNVTCISTCPHATWLTAFGLKNGLVVVADLRRNGKVLYKLRGHEKSVLSLSWCPAPINIFPINPLNHVGSKIEAIESKEISENSILKTEADAKKSNSVSPQSPKINGNDIDESKRDNKTDASGSDEPRQNGFHHLLKVYESGDEDFLKECQKLRNKISGMADANTSDSSQNQSPALLKPNSNVLEAEIKSEADNTSASVPEKDSEDKNSSGESLEGVSSKTEISLIFSSRDVSTDVEMADEATEEAFGKDLKDNVDIQRNDSIKKKESENIGDGRHHTVSDVTKYVEEGVGKNEDVLTSSEEQKPGVPNDSVICSTPKKLGDISGTETSSGVVRTDDSERISSCENNPNTIIPESEKCDNPDGENTSDEVGRKIACEAAHMKEKELPRKEFLLASSAKEGTPRIDGDISGNHLLSTEVSKTDNSEIRSGLDIITPAEDKSFQNLDIDKEKSDEVDKTDTKKTCDEIGRSIVTKVAHVEEEELPRKEFLLASSAREGNIYIWRAGTDGRMQTFFSIPNKSNNRKSKTINDKLWITLCWVSPTVLLSSSKTSELLQWTLPKPKDKSKSMSLVHNDHSTMLFSIASPPILYNEFNWLENRNLNVWTVGQDRLLLNTSLSSEKTNLACYPTLGGTVSCLELSPLDPNRLAIGTGDGFIKIWDLSRPHTKQIIMTSFYQKIQSKVMALAWHPTNEMSLAFGTLEGRLGYLDTNNKSKSPVILPHFFKTHIYKMEWAPINGKGKEYGLYVVAEGKVVLFDTSKSGKDPVEIDKPDNTFIYSFAWKKDYSMMLASTKSGFIIVYSPDLKILCKHYFQERLQEIVWHLNSIENTSKQSNWFVSTTSSKKVIVYDFDVESKDNGTKIVAKFEGLGDVVSSVSWSPYDANQLVIASESGVAQVWDVEKDEIISTFMNANCDGIMRAIFSPVDQDYVICGGKDCSVKIWKISENPPKDVNDIISTRKDILKEISAESTDLLPKSELIREETVKVRRVSKSVLLPNFYSKKKTSEIVADLKKLMLWKENSQRVEVNIGDRTEPDILDIFGKNEDMMKLISLNETINKQKGKYNMSTMLTMFRGDMDNSIKETIQERRVTPWIISLAPMVSPKLWLSACETYASQLSEEQDADPLEIATYLLACHKLEEAIDCLCKASMFREALALAKSRLTENDETITKIIEEWAKYSVHTGNFETAAQCNIFLGKYEDAASVLFRRSDMEIMEFAAELAEKSGNEELHKAVLFRYESFKKMCDNGKPEAALPTKAEAFLQKPETKTEVRTVAESADPSVDVEKMNGGMKAYSTDSETFKDASECVCEDESVGAECSKQDISIDRVSQGDKVAQDDTVDLI